jgi:DNA recombination protein RmuC
MLTATSLTVAIALLVGTLIGFLIGRQREKSIAAERLLEEARERTAIEARAAAAEARERSTAQRVEALDAQLRTANADGRRFEVEAQRRLSELEAERERLAENRQLLDTVKTQFSDAFKALATKALEDSNSAFLQLAQSNFATLQEGARGDLDKRQQSIQELIAPVQASLEKVTTQIREIETVRVGSYAALLEQVSSLANTQVELRRETGNLVGALRRPNVRGRWGELQLRRVVELAGMLDRVDFQQQVQVDAEDGTLRPDLIVKLPGGRSIVVDAKAPLAAYLESLETTDETVRAQKIADHARQIRDHIGKLSQKSYWEAFDTPEFVVLFIPGEAFYSAALEQDPNLIEAGIQKKIIIATPTTLIALLRTIAYGWRQEALADDARHIAALGRELYDRLQSVASHWVKLGKGLSGAVKSYNDAVGSMELRVLPAARRFRDLKVAPESDVIEPVEPLDVVPRAFQAEELLLPSPDADPPTE